MCDIHFGVFKLMFIFRFDWANTARLEMPQVKGADFAHKTLAFW